MRNYSPGGFKILPPVVKNLLIINGLFFLATLTFKSAFQIDLYHVFGLHMPFSQNFSPYQFVTYMFMHGDFTHLLFNMFALWMFGNVLENVWGTKRFIAYYFITGFGAAILHYGIIYYQMLPTLNMLNEFLSAPDPETLKAFIESDNFKIISKTNFKHFLNSYNELINSNPSEAMSLAVNYMSQYKVDFMNLPVVVGASGAVFGILLAFGVMFPNTLIYVFFAIPVKAKYFVMIYGGLELYFGLTSHGNIAHFAHLGGMLFGLLVLWYWKKRRGNFYS
ncbi:MAG: rhomboid family intramembrane serine protease [Bacteroidota bacterium]